MTFFIEGVMSILLVDGVVYEPWILETEYELQEMVNEHSKDIFGDKSLYFDNRKLLKSKSGIGSIPDAFVLTLDDYHTWHVVEIELSSHPLFEHVVSQISKFIAGLRNPVSQSQIVNVLYEEIIKDDFLRLHLKKQIGSTEIHKYISDVISKEPTLTVVIEEETEELREAVNAIPYGNTKTLQFQTYVRKGIGLAAHAHVFEPLLSPTIHPPPPTYDSVVITLSNPTCLNFHLFFVTKECRSFFPGYKVPFVLETDIGPIETCVSSAPKGTEKGNPTAGMYVQRKLANWFRAHQELAVGSQIVVEALEPGKRYRLTINKA